LRIIEIDTGGNNTLDVIEIYSEWKDWARTDDNAKYPPAFRAVGGDPTVGSEYLDATFYLRNGWRIRPAEHDHRLVLDGNLYVDGEDVPPDVPTLGGYSVNVSLKLSTSVRAISGATDIWSAAMADNKDAGSVGEALWKAMLAKFDAPT
jgi:hypothetical protein